MKEKRKSNGFA